MQTIQNSLMKKDLMGVHIDKSPTHADWEQVDINFGLLFIVTVIDPRCKLELVKVRFKLIYDVQNCRR